MNDKIAIILIVTSGLLAAISQLILKISAKKKQLYWWKEYLNFGVIFSYAILMLTTLINMQAMVYLPYKIAVVIGSSSYIFVILFSKLFLKEFISFRKKIGMGCILLGIIIFNL